MNDKKLNLILQRLDKLEQLETELKKIKTEYVIDERLQKIEAEICTTRKWIMTLIENVATLYEIAKNNGQKVLVKR